MSTNNLQAKPIRNTLQTGKPVDIPLQTSQRVLARITDGIYRQPASALRELISNAYDADAQEVVITTDAPRFQEISVKDDGIGISPESLKYLIENIGDSAKRSAVGSALHITADDSAFSPKGRKLIGNLGIGLFAVAQFTRHFLIITKCEGDNFRTIADVTLSGHDKVKYTDGTKTIKSGQARVWVEKASNVKAHGTEVKLLDLLPRTRAEFQSFDRWYRVDYENQEDVRPRSKPPVFHIGRMAADDPDQLAQQPNLPWDTKDEPDVRFRNLVHAVRHLASSDRKLVDLDLICDNYLLTIWNLALACPLDYIEFHPFDLPKNTSTLFYSLENKTNGQAAALGLSKHETPRDKLQLTSPRRPENDRFQVIIDAIEISRPILFTNQPRTEHAITTPLMFIGKCREEFSGKSFTMSGGPLDFEAYLFWTPKVLPKQHRGVMLRVGNAAGALFDRTFMDYQVSEQTRLRQITAEIFVHEGLDVAINLDRESFNFAHPHYQFLTKWLHSAIRQLSNKHKAVGKEIRDKRRTASSQKAKRSIARAVAKKLQDVEVDDLVEVKFIDETLFDSVIAMRDEGIMAFEGDSIFSVNGAKSESAVRRNDINEQKAVALIQLLYGWGLLDDLSYDDQAILIRDILELMLMEEGK